MSITAIVGFIAVVLIFFMRFLIYTPSGGQDIPQEERYSLGARIAIFILYAACAGIVIGIGASDYARGRDAPPSCEYDDMVDLIHTTETGIEIPGCPGFLDHSRNSE